jgi:LmbE family N-acetylglucosaminyl deacetylase
MPTLAQNHAMNTFSSSRRGFVKNSLALAAPTLLAAEVLAASAAQAETKANPGRPLRIVCVGAHPDDPESGCGGAMIRCSELGHAVTVIYLTRGERGIPGKSDDEAARIRSSEAEAACRIIGAKPVFAGQVDGSAEFTRVRLGQMMKLMEEADPDVIFTHWPVDTHFDHQVASLLAIRSQMTLPRRPRLYFFEVNAGSQTQGFSPNAYVDISACLEKKKSALFAHHSQGGESIWSDHHQIMAAFRGRESGVAAAEAFVRLSRTTRSETFPDFLM